jgi:predicted nucleotidyltransferase
MTSQDPRAAYQLMRSMTTSLRSAVSSLYDLARVDLRCPPNDIAIFLYGSPARNELTSYSDIDLHVIDEQQSPQSRALQERVRADLATLGFGKVDDPHWERFHVMEHYASKSMTEGNQVLDTTFVCGDLTMNRTITSMKARHDTRDRNVRNFIFQSHYLTHYYEQKARADAENIKYCAGGYRDLLVLNWFDKIMRLTHADWDPLLRDRGQPHIERTLENLTHNGMVTPDQGRACSNAVSFLVMLRNEALHVNQGTSDKGLTYLDDALCQRLLSASPDYFRRQGIVQPRDLRMAFAAARGTILTMKQQMLERVVQDEAAQKGPAWLAAMRTGQTLGNGHDPLLQLETIWRAQERGDRDTFTRAAYATLQTDQWEAWASLACSPLCPPDVLGVVADTALTEVGLGYILRILGRHPQLPRATLEKIASSSLDKHYRVVAQLHLEHGLQHAIERAP